MENQGSSDSTGVGMACGCLLLVQLITSEQRRHVRITLAKSRYQGDLQSAVGRGVPSIPGITHSGDGPWLCARQENRL